MARQLVEERLAFIEMLALWQGEVRNCEVVKQFTISRQQVYKDISQYQARYPAVLTKQMDGRYCFQDTALPIFYDGDLDTYLHWLQTNEFSPTSKLLSQ
ncbi:hypothetical protein [Shewanella dokdonensis]|uniref:hypothetical protein n=1 Tax=Shewanella dokdonensis TaxID=712036 RepID=UPI00200EEA16|nr:hypothetical protein [Shewanella dokdonensis]MCL1075911.1 hypothetical protein [Shewanella dokdonensis]